MIKYKKGNIVKGTVTAIVGYGIFVSVDESFSGLIHISEISPFYIKDIYEYVNVGEEVYVEILDIDYSKKRLNLSIKNINYKIRNRKKIIETPRGFCTLAYKLPYWIVEGLERYNYLNSEQNR